MKDENSVSAEDSARENTGIAPVSGIFRRIASVFPQALRLSRGSAIALFSAALVLALFCAGIAIYEFFCNPSAETFFAYFCKLLGRFFVFFVIFIWLVRVLPFPLRAIAWFAVLLFPALDWGIFFYTGSSAFTFVLRNAFVTNAVEVLGWIDFTSCALLLAFLAACGALAWFFRLKENDGNAPIALKIVSACVIVFSFAFPCIVLTSERFEGKKEHKKIRSLAKSLIGNPIYHYAETFAQARQASDFYYLEKLPSLALFPSTARDESENLIIFLHIGESVRSADLPFFGYGRETMPNCAAFKARGNLFDFNALSFAADTTMSTLGMMTDAKIAAGTPGRVRAAHRSFADLLAKHKFAVAQFYSFGNIVGAYGMECVPLALLMRDFPPAMREPVRADLCPKIAETAQRSPRAFMLFNGRGSHHKFEFSEKFAKFVPADGSREEDWRAGYDNTILETDDFIGNAVRALGDRPFVYIFVSDHGINLGENGVFGRAGNSIRSATVRNVPLLIYVSDAFRERFPQLAENLARNRARFPTVSQEYVFHTILGLAGIRTELPAGTPFRGYCAALDLSSAEATGAISPALAQGINLP